MAWITIDPTKVPLSAAEITKIDCVVGRVTMPEIVNRVVRMVQGRVAVLSPIGQPGTIPEELEEAAMALVVERYLNQVPAGTLLLTEQRQKAVDAANSILRDVAKGLFKMVSPDVPAAKQASPQMETIVPGNRGDNREDLHRL